MKSAGKLETNSSMDWGFVWESGRVDFNLEVWVSGYLGIWRLVSTSFFDDHF